MIIFKKSTKITYKLEVEKNDGVGWSEVLKQLTKFTHQLETVGDDEIKFSNIWASSRTV